MPETVVFSKLEKKKFQILFVKRSFKTIIFKATINLKDKEELVIPEVVINFYNLNITTLLAMKDPEYLHVRLQTQLIDSEEKKKACSDLILNIKTREEKFQLEMNEGKDYDILFGDGC